ncbi:Nuclear transport factor 2 [Coemansia sp. RSA 552]|nr:Nuclear transport factor 2 [Coemansia sp. RSA 552]
MADISAIGKSFSEFYYQTFDGSRAELANLYKDESMLTWEGNQFCGNAAIMEKLLTLPFQRIAHKVTTIDTQPSVPGANSIIVCVTGQLQIDDEPRPQQFTQFFQLVDRDGSVYIHNDIFRLNYA